ncbi:OmpW/AlkL family protein [Ralstonia mojiangensis]|uniref:OmpW/AlkL family protein n=1 Tax=Ralstonia mojiangensis TaxID=2953895 RepID=UPI0020907B8A|nr:OmpW family outer membrane protein [Ralstonia mojiangensis]MCO5412194.1 outer membrane beta-barrel protein [Ralstonia mojiangensis]MCT7326000.1 outer membrane beta-barrel protein [Ralstonia mojiangensis]
MAYKKALAAAAGMILATAAHAQAAGSNIVSLGWFRVMPNSSSDPLFINSVGGAPINQSVPNTGAKIKEADTVGLAFTHFFTDNIAVELVGGIPPRHKIEGTGSFSGYGEIGSAKQWSPAVLAKWYFFSADSKFRPYVGAGLNYTWFSDEKITNSAFQNQVLGRGTPGSTSSVTTDSSLNPVLNVGATYAITKDWFVGLSVSYLPLKTTAKIDTTLINGVHIQSEAKIKINPVVTFLNVGYRF